MSSSRKGRWRDNLGFLVNRLAAAMQAEFEMQLAPYEVSRLQWNILRDLYDAVQRPANLALKVGCDRAVMTRLLAGLERRGLVQRQISMQDRRQIDVSLTDKGRVLTDSLMEVSKNVNEKFLRGISKEQANDVISTLRQILTNTAATGSRVA